MFTRPRKNLVLVIVILMAILVLGPTAATKTTITFWMGSWWLEQSPLIVEKFESANPDIEVKFDGLPIVGFLAKVTTATMGPNAPDVLSVSTPAMMPCLAAQGLLTDLGPFIDKSNIVRPDAYFPESWKSGQYMGTQYAVPHRIITAVLNYNTNMFADAGLDPARPPETSDEVLEYAKKMTIPGERYGFAFAASTKSPDHTTQIIGPSMWAKGGDYLNEDYSKATINSPEAVAAFEYLRDLYIEHCVVPAGILSYDLVDISRLFGAETVAMINVGQWAQGLIQEIATPTLQYKFAPSPDKKAMGGGWILTIPTNSKKKEAAWRLLEWFTDPNVLPEISVRLPATKSAIDHPKWGANPSLKPFFDSMEYVTIPPRIEEWAEIELLAIGEFQNILLERKSVEQALNDAARAIDELLK